MTGWKCFFRGTDVEVREWKGRTISHLENTVFLLIDVGTQMKLGKLAEFTEGLEIKTHIFMFLCFRTYGCMPVRLLTSKHESPVNISTSWRDMNYGWSPSLSSRLFFFLRQHTVKTRIFGHFFLSRSTKAYIFSVVRRGTMIHIVLCYITDRWCVQQGDEKVNMMTSRDVDDHGDICLITQRQKLEGKGEFDKWSTKYHHGHNSTDTFNIRNDKGKHTNKWRD